MREALILVSALAMGAATVKMYRDTVGRKTSSSLTTWLMFEVGVILSFFTYLDTSDPRGFWEFVARSMSNIANTKDVFSVNTIFLTLLVCKLVGYRRERATRTNPGWMVWVQNNLVDLMAIAGMVGAAYFWWKYRMAERANWAIQVIMFVAYAPSLRHLWMVGRNVQSFKFWLLVLTAETSGLAVAWLSGNDWLPRIYALRSVVAVTGLLGLMLYLELRPRNKKQ